METGQITRGSNFGEIIYNLTKRVDVENIVEIGTWCGLGSTKCIIDGIIDSQSIKKTNFITIELYEDIYNEAKHNLKEYSNYVTILNGGIIDYDDIFWFDKEWFLNEYCKQTGKIADLYHYNLWWEKDLENLKKSTNVISQLPEKIDFLILDGGEWSTYPEWCKLRDRTRIIAMDDINFFKCDKIVEELSSDPNWKEVHKVTSDRNGFGVFERI